MMRQLMGLWSPWFGIMIMLMFTGLAAFARPLFLSRVPAFMRTPRPWETAGAIYKSLRVPEFGTLLRRTPLRALNPLVYLSPTDPPSAVIAQLEHAEATHYVAGALLVPHTVYAFMQGRIVPFVGLMLAQVLFNLYPIMHLRWARIRLERLRMRVSNTSRRTSAMIAA